MIKQITDISIFCDGLDHPECIAVHPDGSVWAGGEAGQVYRISHDGKTSELIASTNGFILGIAISPDSRWLAVCDLKNHCVWKLDILSKTLTYILREIAGESIQIPNYPVFDDDGNLYVSDSGSFRQINGRILRIDSSGNAVVWHPGPFNFPNGMALCKKRKSLFIVCSWLPGVEKIEILPDGTFGEREIVVRMPNTCPDGIALDTEGSLYISCYAPNTIYRVKGTGKMETLVHDWEAHTISNPTNIAFGGYDHKQLFIANLGRWHISVMSMDIAGSLLPCFNR